MNRKLIIEKLLKEGFSEKTLLGFNDKQLITLSSTVLKENTKMIPSGNAQDIEAAMKNKETFVKYESKQKDVNEKWKGDVKVKKTGEHADKSVAELKKELNSLKEKSKKYQDEGKKVPKNIIDQEAELKFAIRAKQGWKKKMNENVSEIEEWVLDLTESKYTHFTSKNDIMKIINEKMETFQPMPTTKAKKGHNGVPEFMSYDAIVGNQPASSTNPSQPDAPPKEKDKPKRRPTYPGIAPDEREPITPYRPKPGIDPKPKGVFGNQPAPSTNPSQPDVLPDAPPKEKDNPKRRTPYDPGPRTDPKPKGLGERKNIK
jgi:hypothetical protein